MIEQAAVDAGASFAVLAWSVKASFCSYVARLADGECEITEGVRLLGEGRYGLPGCVQPIPEPATFEWRSEASVTFRAHGGLLHVSLQAPVIRLDHAGGSVALRGPGDVPEEEIAALRHVTQSGNIIAAQPVLTEAGAVLFGGYYQAGDALDELQLILSNDAIAVPARQSER